MCHLICMEVMEEQLTFIFSFFSVCACSRMVVASASLGNSVSASSVPNACRVCAVVFTIRANASIACGEGIKTWILQQKLEKMQVWGKSKYTYFIKTQFKGAQCVLHVCSYSAVWDPAVMVVLLRSSQLCCQLSRINVGMELSHWTQHYHLKKNA